MIGNNQYKNAWTKEEENYLIENYKKFSKFELARKIERTPDAIKRKLVRMGLKRIKEEGLKIKHRLQSGKNHWNYGKRNTEMGRIHIAQGQARRFQDKNQRLIMKRIRANQIFPKKDSSIEVKIQNFLKQLGIEFFTHQHMKIKHSYQCDIFIPSKNLVIECDGNYWHSYPVGKELDEIRASELIQSGVKILRLWEFDIKEMDLGDFQNIIYDY